MAVTHVAFDFRLRCQGRNGVNHHHINSTGTNYHVTNFQGLLTGIRLADQQTINIDAQVTGINWIQRVLSIDKGTGATGLLCFRDDLKGQRGFTG